MIFRTSARIPRWVAFVAAAGFVGALLPLGQASAGHADAGEKDSSITIEWGTGKVTVGPDATATKDEVAAVQPNHAALTSDGAGGDAGSGHWSDFKDLKVTVSQTTALGDQVVALSASGMKQTIADATLGGSNFLQVFQCYGKDPSSADFTKTCQWGGFSESATGASIPKGLVQVLGNFADSAVGRGGVPFRAVQGVESSPATTPTGGTNQGIGRFFDSSSSSEQPFVPFDARGLAQTNVVTQSAAAQPYLGCGDPAAAGERCWLVLVPRGIHSNNLRGDEATCGRPLTTNRFGGSTLYQTGDIFAPECSLWADRIVIPLDFANPYSTCPAGSAERRIVGSEFLSEAMSSWQSSLCQGGGAAFALTTNSGNLARSQLVTGQTALAAVSQPVTAKTIGPTDPALLETSDFRYAPLTNTALTIGFLIDEKDGTSRRQIRLTPRLIAKMLTQSYWWDIPTITLNSAASVTESRAKLKWTNLFDDEEWKALGNPTNFAGNVKASWEVIGPQGDDAIRLLWRYVLSDADALAFLRGTPDPWGATINPYYLPPADGNALGGGYDLLSEAIDTFPKADRSTNVSVEVANNQYKGIVIDSTSYIPYAGSFAANAARIARADSQRAEEWDPNAAPGKWVSAGPQMPANRQGRIVLGPLTAAASSSYGLDNAELALPLRSTTTADTVASAREFVAYSEASVVKAVAAQPPAATDTIVETDPSTLPSGAYPLASTLYAAVDMNSTALNDSARTDYAALLDYSAASTYTGDRGGLPKGYVALSEQQKSVSAAVATELRTPKPVAAASGGPGAQSAAGNNNSAAAVPAAASVPGGNSPATSMSSSATTAAASTEAASAGGQAALGGVLVAGVAGVAVSPFLLRRRSSG